MSKRYKRESPIAGPAFITGPVHLLWRQYDLTLCGQRIWTGTRRQVIRAGKEALSEGKAPCELCLHVEGVMERDAAQPQGE